MSEEMLAKVRAASPWTLQLATNVASKAVSAKTLDPALILLIVQLIATLITYLMKRSKTDVDALKLWAHPGILGELATLVMARRVLTGDYQQYAWAISREILLMGKNND